MKNVRMVVATCLLLSTVALNAQDKKNVKTYEAVPELSVQGDVKQDAKTDLNKEEPDTYPSFVGGDKAFFKYLGENIKYPDYEKKNDIQGNVIASFIVNADGSIGKIEILKSVKGSKNLNAEVIRVLKSMPKWNPATKDDKAVKAIMNIPVKFQL